jgi:hypothetical protein
MRALITLFFFGLAAPVWAQNVLPGTTPWAFPADIVAEQYAEQRAFYERQIAEASQSRAAVPAAGDRDAARADLRKIIGAVDTPIPAKPQFTALQDRGGIRVSLSRSGRVEALAFRRRLQHARRRISSGNGRLSTRRAHGVRDPSALGVDYEIPAASVERRGGNASARSDPGHLWAA